MTQSLDEKLNIIDVPETEKVVIPKSTYIVFDIDETISATGEIHDTIFKDFLQNEFSSFFTTNNLTYSEELIPPYSGHCYTKIMLNWAENYQGTEYYQEATNLAAEKITLWKNESEKIYAEYKDRISIYPDAIPLIRTINETRKEIGIITNATGWFLDHVKEKLGEQFFSPEVIKTQYVNETFSINRKKPSGYPFKKLSKEIEVQCENIAIIGDSYSDVGAAANGNIGACYFVNRKNISLRNEKHPFNIVQANIDQGKKSIQTKFYNISNLEQILLKS